MSPSPNKLEASLRVEGEISQLVVHAVRGTERVSAPFRYEVDFTADFLDVPAALGGPAELHLQDTLGHERFLSGVVQKLSVIGNADPRTRYRAVLVPTPYLLSYRHGSRIFQKKTIPQVVQEVFRKAGFDDKLFHWDLKGKHPEPAFVVRAFVVQYDESEWAFINRLLEEAGIHYAFEQTADGDRMVFRDVSSAAPATQPPDLAFHYDHQLHGDAARAWDVASESRACVSKVAIGDYDMLTPSADLRAQKKVDDPACPAREWYEYPAGHSDPAQSKSLAQERLEELRVQRSLVRARTNALFAEAGRILHLVEHPSISEECFITRVDLAIRIDREEAQGPLVDPGPQQCELALELLPKKHAFRPSRSTPRPRILGMQTARVTGPGKEEIHCDKHGRVKVQFHWDRDGQLDDDTSCWLRVAQTHTTGSVMIPRVGWEVLVEFIHGDPDRPVCCGRLYNPDFQPPFELPAQKTVSGHKSHSSPGAGGHNEVRFDDASGSQQFAIAGHRDVNVRVANKAKSKVTKKETRSVGLDRSVTIGAEEKIAVVADEKRKVGGNHSVTVGATRKVKVNGDACQVVKSGLNLTVDGAEMRQIGSPSTAVLNLIASMAITAAQGAAAGAVDRAQGALLAPLAPALNVARGALGAGMKLPGPAGGLLSGDPALMAAALGIGPGGKVTAKSSDEEAEASGEDANAGGNPEANGSMDALNQSSAMASGAAAAIASGAMAKAGLPAQAGAAGGGGGGSSGGDGGAAGGGTWGVTVGLAVTERIGALAAINSLMPVSFAIGGACSETVGAARIEAIAGGKIETTNASKLETVAGAYVVNVSEKMSIESGAAIVSNVLGKLTQKIGKDHGISSDGPALVTTSRLKLKASDKITLKCGQSEVVISSDGVELKGTAITVKGSQKLKLDPAAIKPG